MSKAWVIPHGVMVELPRRTAVTFTHPGRYTVEVDRDGRVWVTQHTGAAVSLTVQDG